MKPFREVSGEVKFTSLMGLLITKVFSYNFQPDTKDTLVLVRKFFYTLLFMKFYVYVSKLNNSSLVLTGIITRINYKYKIENL